MGCTQSLSSPQEIFSYTKKAENELLNQFLFYCNSPDDWITISGNSSTLASVTKLNPKEKSNFITYRGVSMVSGTIDDLYHFFENNLGGDRFELLEEIDERRAVFYWFHEFGFHRNNGSIVKVNGAGMISNTPYSTLSSNDDHLAISNVNTTTITINVEPPSSPVQRSASSRTKDGFSEMVDINPSVSISIPQNPQEDLTRARPRMTNMLFRRATIQKTINFIQNREFLLYRTVFKLSSTKICIVLESTEHKLKKKIEEDTTRGIVDMMGILIEELSEDEKKTLFNFSAVEANSENDPDAFINVKRKLREPLSKITFLTSIDPRFTDEESGRIPENELSQLCGEAKIRDVVDGVKTYFESDENKFFVKFRALAASPIGELGWVEQEKSKTDLQLGTNVKHHKYGHGIVKKFDMKGRIHVAYDNGEVIEHEPTEKDSLHVAVQIGTRVKHPSRGAGTVKQFDETGRIHVKFDNGEYHRYKQAAWRKKMHEYKLLGTGGALETITLAYRDADESREKQGRVKFAVGVTTREVLEYILDYEEDEKTGNVIKNEVIEEISLFHRIRYQVRRMPQPLTPRDFVFDEIWREVAPKTYVIVNRSIEHPLKKEVPGIVRGMIIQSGYLIEPLYTEDGMDHIAQITHILCIDPQGFVPPDAVAGIRAAQLLGAVTDMRAHFWRRTQQKKSVNIINRKRISKRTSGNSTNHNRNTSIPINGTISARIKSPVST